MSLTKNCRLYVRWLGAFGRGGALGDSLHHELSLAFSKNACGKEFACEGIVSATTMGQCRIGLAVRPENIVKTFNGDCYSEKGADGRLSATRNPRHGNHDYVESWGKYQRKNRAAYYGIVIKQHGEYVTGMRANFSLKSFSEDVQKLLCRMADRYGLPIYRLDGNRLVLVREPGKH